MNRRIKHTFFLVILLSSPILGQRNYYFPGKIWETKNAIDLNFKSALLDTAINFAIKNENSVETDLRMSLLKSYANEPNYSILGPVKSRGKASGMIIKNGYIIGQWGDINRVDMSFSATKSFLSSVAGLAIDRQMITSTDDLVNKYVWDGSYDGPHNAQVTWKHLLEQTSDWSGCQFGICDWADRPPKLGSIDDWKQRKLLQPGTTFEYNDVRVNLLSYSLLQVWRKTLPQVLKENIMDPIGASSTWRWYGYDNAFVNVDGLMMQSVSGGGHHGGGLFINTVDMAKYGYLFLRNGMWKDKQILSKAWIEEATKPSAINKTYGYLWWNNSENEWLGVPKSIYFAAGYGGNYIIVDKEHDLVVVLRWIDSDRVGMFMEKLLLSFQ
jgi:hypothetical protein